MSGKHRFAEHVLVPLLLAVATAVLLALLYFLYEYGQTQHPGAARQYHFSTAELRQYAHFTGTQTALLAGLLVSLLAALWLNKRTLYALSLLLSVGYLVQLLIR